MTLTGSSATTPTTVFITHAGVLQGKAGAREGFTRLFEDCANRV